MPRWWHSDVPLKGAFAHWRQWRIQHWWADSGDFNPNPGDIIIQSGGSSTPTKEWRHIPQPILLWMSFCGGQVVPAAILGLSLSLSVSQSLSAVCRSNVRTIFRGVIFRLPLVFTNCALICLFLSLGVWNFRLGQPCDWQLSPPSLSLLSPFELHTLYQTDKNTLRSTSTIAL